MIKLSLSRVVDPGFIAAVRALRGCRLPLLHVKQLDKILDVLDREREAYMKDTSEQRDRIFGETIGDRTRELLLAAHDPARLAKVAEQHGVGDGDLAGFQAQYQEFDSYCTELGKTEVKVQVKPLQLPDTFDGLSYNHAKALADLINLQ